MRRLESIAVVFALEAEWAPWRSRHPFHAVSNNEPTVYEGLVGPLRTRVALCGVGARRTRQILDVLCAAHIDALLAVGLAGALRDPYVCGDVIVARRAQLAASGSFVAGDARLIEAASRCGAKVVDVLLCADHVAGRPGPLDEKRRLAAQGEAVDMESFRILEEAARRGIPSVAIRVIGDSADETLPLDFDRAVRADGTVDLMKLVGQAVRVPSRWPALIAFGFRQRRAVRALAGFLDRFVASIE